MHYMGEKKNGKTIIIKLNAHCQAKKCFSFGCQRKQEETSQTQTATLFFSFCSYQILTFRMEDKDFS